MGAVTGGIVGLVGITPGAGYVPLWSSLIIGATAAPICYLAISKMKKSSAMTMHWTHSAATVSAVSGAVS